MNSMNIDSQLPWCLHPYFKPHIKHWGQDYVLFDEVSGDTHILDSLAGFVLSTLMSSPATVDALSGRLSEDQDCPIEELKSLVSDVLIELAELDFVDRVST